MEAKFSRSSFIKTAFIASYILGVLSFSAVLLSIGNSANGVKVSLIFTIIFVSCTLVVNDLRGVMTADEKEVVIVLTFHEKTVMKRSLEYSQINSIMCSVKTYISAPRTIWRETGYLINLTIEMNDGSKIEFFKKLDIDKDFPVTQPDEYKKYISEQPLMKISHYIDSKLHLNTSA